MWLFASMSDILLLGSARTNEGSAGDAMIIQLKSKIYWKNISDIGADWYGVLQTSAAENVGQTPQDVSRVRGTTTCKVGYLKPQDEEVGLTYIYWQLLFWYLSCGHIVVQGG